MKIQVSIIGAGEVQAFIKDLRQILDDPLLTADEIRARILLRVEQLYASGEANENDVLHDS